MDTQALRVACHDALHDAGHPELAALVVLAAEEIDKAAPAIYDRHGVLAEWPGVKDAIDRWIADPAPRLPGLRIRVRDGNLPYHRSLELQLSRKYPVGQQVGQMGVAKIIAGWELERPDRLLARIHHTLTAMHLEMVDHMRQNPA
jgi:hypothetical protein